MYIPVLWMVFLETNGNQHLWRKWRKLWCWKSLDISSFLGDWKFSWAPAFWSTHRYILCIYFYIYIIYIYTRWWFQIIFEFPQRSLGKWSSFQFGIYSFGALKPPISVWFIHWVYIFFLDLFKVIVYFCWFEKKCWMPFVQPFLPSKSRTYSNIL